MVLLLRNFLYSFGFFVLFSTIPLVAYAQQGDAETVFEHRQEFRFRPGIQQGSAHVVNALLQLASEGGQKLRVYTTYSFSVGAQLQPAEGGEKLALHLRSINVEGDTRYGDFSMVPWQIPTLFDMEIAAQPRNGGSSQHFTFNNVSIAGAPVGDTLIFLTLNGQRADSFKEFSVKRLHFYYPETHLKEVEYLLDALNAYYQTPAQLAKAQALIAGLEQTRVEDLILEEFRLCEAEIIAAQLTHGSFRGFIRQSGSDPLQAEPQLARLQNDLASLRAWFNFRIAHIDSILFARGSELLANGAVSEARVFFERTLVFNPQHIPAHSRIADLDLAVGKTEEVMRRLKVFMGKMGAPSVWKQEALAITQRLFYTEISRADELAEDGRFLDARHVLEKLENFCDQLVQWDCPAELKEKLQQVHYGMYRSYLSVARRAFVNGNLSFAVTYGTSALEYQQEHSGYIANTSEVWGLFQMVLEAHQQQAIRAGMFHDYNTMATHLQQANDLCSRFEELRCPAGLAEHVEETKRARDQARQIVVEYVVTQPPVGRTALTLEQATRQVRDLLSQGHLRAWAGETSGARELLNEITEYAIRYDLRRDTLINARIISLGNMIRNKECEAEIQQGNKLVEEISERIARGFFLEANDSYQALQAINESVSRCNHDFSVSLQRMSYVEQLAHYQLLINEAQSAYFRGSQTGFDIFLVKYRKAEDYAQTHELFNRGLGHTSLADFVAGSSNTSLVKAAVRFFADEQRHLLALQMLFILKESRLDAREVRALQEYAAKQAALSMRNEQPAVQARARAREITQNDPWFRYYVRSFVGAFSN